MLWKECYVHSRKYNGKLSFHSLVHMVNSQHANTDVHVQGCTCSNSTSLPHPIRTLKQDESKTTLSPATSQPHPSYAQQFLSVKVSNRAARRQMSRHATARKHQRDSYFQFMSHSNMNPLNQDVGKQIKKKNYGKITEISVSFEFIALQMKLR